MKAHLSLEQKQEVDASGTLDVSAKHDLLARIGALHRNLCRVGCGVGWGATIDGQSRSQALHSSNQS